MRFSAVDWAIAGEATAIKGDDATVAVKARRWDLCSVNAASLEICVPIALKNPAQPYFNERLNKQIDVSGAGKRAAALWPPVKNATNKQPRITSIQCAGIAVKQKRHQILRKKKPRER